MTDVSVTTAGDVSSLDSAPVVGLREWVLGARPVVGAIAASGLMLLACSWFAFSSGVLGPRHDVGGPDPVRIGGTTPQLVGGPSRAAARSPTSPASTGDASASPTPPPVVPDAVTSNLPAPLDDLPSVPLPPPPVTVPDLSVPAVPAVTTSLGVP